MISEYLKKHLLSFIFAAIFACLSFGAVETFADVTIDNGSPGTSSTGTWRVSSGSSPYGPDSLWARDGATYTWQFDPMEPAGTYEVFMWWSEWPSRATNIAVDINHDVGQTSLTINQHENAGQWNSLGNYYFDSSGSVVITASYGSTVSTCADAVWFSFISDSPPPTAHIDSITPNPADPDHIFDFLGHGTDDGSIQAYEWESSIDGILSNSASFTSTLLTEGTHNISFRVQDDNDIWS